MKRYDFVTFTLNQSRVVVILTGAACATGDVARIERTSQLRWPQHIRVICQETEDGEAEFTGTCDKIISLLDGCPMQHLRGLVTGEIEA